MLLHFVACGINIRNLLDWAFFWEKQGNEVDVKWLNDFLECHHMNEFFSIINSICVNVFGFEATFFPSISLNSDLKYRVLNEILYPKYNRLGAHNRNIFKRVLF